MELSALWWRGRCGSGSIIRRVCKGHNGHNHVIVESCAPRRRRPGHSADMIEGGLAMPRLLLLIALLLAAD